MFAYCCNNPINCKDPYGDFFGYITRDNLIPIATNVLLPVACQFMLTWLNGDGSTQYYDGGSNVCSAIKESEKMRGYIDDAISYYKGSGDPVFHGTSEFTHAEDGWDLYLAIQHFDYTITVVEERAPTRLLFRGQEKVRYVVTIQVHDTYDFTKREWESIGDYLNNGAYYLHNMGVGEDYEWYATYTYTTRWTFVR